LSKQDTLPPSGWSVYTCN